MVEYEIKKTIGKLSEQKGGWKRLLRIVAWNGGEPKYDIRDWSPDDTKMGRGITLNEHEAVVLCRSLMVEFGGYGNGED